MIIGFTGTQSGMTKFQKDTLPEVLKIKQPTEFLIGDCIGSDYQAALIAVDFGVQIFTVYPPEDIRKRAFFADPERSTKWNRIITPYMDRVVNGKQIKVKWMPVDAYLKRNKALVEACSCLIATPKEHKHTLRSGTWATIRHAWHLKKDEIIIPPIERPENGI